MPSAPPNKLSHGVATPIEGCAILEAGAHAQPRKHSASSGKIVLAAKMGEWSWNQWRIVSEAESENSVTCQTMQEYRCLTPSTKINSK